MNINYDKAILVKKETTSGTYEAPANTDLVYFMGEPTIKSDVKMYDRGHKWGTIDKLTGIPAQRKATVNFDMELNPQLFVDTNYVAVVGALFEACGFEKTHNATAPITDTFTLGSTTVMLANSISIKFMEGASTYEIAGARGTVKVDGAIGEPLKASFTFEGIINSVTGGAVDYSVFTYTTTTPDIVIGTGITGLIDNDGVSSFELDMGNKTQEVSDIAASYGIKSIFISERQPTFKVDPAMTTQSISDLISQFDGQTSEALSYQTSGTTYNIKIDLSAKALPYAGKTREGIIVIDLSYQADAVTITFTEGS